MHNLLKIFGMSVASVGLFALCGPVSAAQSAGRAAYNVRSGVSVSSSPSSQRMPTMPTLPGNAIGNLSPNLPTTGGNGGGTVNPPNPPQPQPDCADGGVKNSDYGIENCMNDILSCVNNGALPGGLNDLFNEDLRNSIVNGMGLCTIQVQKCITDVRVDCANVYRSAADVWIDFNARRVQPEYYNFVLRKTGLTPNQAENTCWLLDKNTYGSSFDAVSNDGGVTAEYNQNVGAYNGRQGNVLIKTNPQGVQVNNNNNGVDGQRGHYARWDATTATCYLRVAAYNKDSHIKNSWLFGALGDDKPAEVWRAAGETFTCNKDLFGFSLMNQTSTVAVVGVGGGTVLGVGVGAIAGHGKRDFDCSNDGQRKKLTEELRSIGNVAILNEYLDPSNRIATAGGTLSAEQCEDIVNLYNVYRQVDTALDDCLESEIDSKTMIEIKWDVMIPEDGLENYLARVAPSCTGRNFTTSQQCANYLMNSCRDAGMTADACIEHLMRQGVSPDVLSIKTEVSGNCTFKPINLAKRDGMDIYCTAQSGCVDSKEMRKQTDRLGRVLKNIEILQGEKSNMGKSIGIGAAAGAGAGGLATAITAFVERNNINCRIGDGLDQVGFGKSYSIGSLKDFYVKWNLRLPDTITPTPHVVDCDSWKRTCATLVDLNQCKAAQINYKPADATTTTLVSSACIPSGSTCIENYPVAKSHGACK